MKTWNNLHTEQVGEWIDWWGGLVGWCLGRACDVESLGTLVAKTGLT